MSIKYGLEVVKNVDFLGGLLHTNLSLEKYEPKNKFGGYTECYKKRFLSF